MVGERSLHFEHRYTARKRQVATRLPPLTPNLTERFKEIAQYPDVFLPPDCIKFDPFSGKIYIKTTRAGRPTFSTHRTVENAIRSAGHVHERYRQTGGVEVEHAKGLISLIKDALHQFRYEKITKEVLEDMLTKAERALKRSGYLKSRIPNRKKIVNQMLAAFHTDSANHINDMISRTRLASAWMKLISELLKNKRIRDKYHNIMELLTVEKLVEEFHLREVRQIMDEIIQTTDYDQIKKLIMILKERCETNLISTNIKAAPYRLPALLTRAYLFGIVSNKHEELLAKILQDEEILKYFKAQKPLDSLSQGLDSNPDVVLPEIKDRLNQCLKRINPVLAEEAMAPQAGESSPEVDDPIPGHPKQSSFLI